MAKLPPTSNELKVLYSFLSLCPTPNSANPTAKPSTVRMVSLIQFWSMAYLTKNPTPRMKISIPIFPNRFSPMKRS